MVAAPIFVLNSDGMSKKLPVLGLVALVLTAVALEFFQRGNLADPLPFALTLVGAIGGASLGYLAFTSAATASAPMDEKPYRKFVSLLSFPLFGLFAGTLVMRSLYLQIAFAGLEAKPQISLLQVEDADQQRKRTFSDRTYRYIISLPGGGRSFRVLVSRELYEKVGPRKPPAMLHCIRMPVETGRWGIRRVMAPNYTDAPLGVERYRPCQAQL